MAKDQVMDAARPAVRSVEARITLGPDDEPRWSRSLSQEVLSEIEKHAGEIAKELGSCSRSDYTFRCQYSRRVDDDETDPGIAKVYWNFWDVKSAQVGV